MDFSPTLEGLLRFIAPGVMTHQLWSNTQETTYSTFEALNIQIETGFFKSLQVLTITHREERVRIGQLLQTTGCQLNYCLADLIRREHVDIASLDRSSRLNACSRIRAAFEDAAECGASYVQLLTGPSPESEEKRREALRVLEDSLVELCFCANLDYQLHVLIEPLDVRVHKKGTLGYAEETAHLIRNVRRHSLKVSCIFDTAHAELNNEPPETVFGEIHDTVEEMHLCNCVLDKEHPWYGDSHPPFGPPGVFDSHRLSLVLEAAYASGFLCTNYPRRVFAEVRVLENKTPAEMLSYCQKVITDTWEMFVAKVEGLINEG